MKDIAYFGLSLALELYPLDELKVLFKNQEGNLHACVVKWAQKLSTSAQHFVAIGEAKPGRGKELRCIAPELVAIVAQCLEPILQITPG